MSTYNVTPDNVSKAALDIVRAEFNPSGDSVVAEAKILTARLITIAQEAASKPGAGRMAAVAITNYEAAAMWLVKALTTPPVTGS